MTRVVILTTSTLRTDDTQVAFSLLVRYPLPGLERLVTASRFDHAPDRRPARLTVGVIGAGRAGGAFAAALHSAGHGVVAATTSSQDPPALRNVPRRPADDVARSCDLLVLTVPDDTLADLVRGLTVTGALRPGQFVLHAAGRYGLDVLAPAVESGCVGLALHPAMTFAGVEVDSSRFAGASIAVTTAPEFRVVGEALAYEMGGEPVFVPDELRPLWHAALTHGANHLVTLVGQAADLLTAAGASDPARVLAPLLTAALENALRSGDDALTGPVARGDAETVRAHLQALATSPALESYQALARATTDRARRSRRLAGADAERVGSALREVRP